MNPDCRHGHPRAVTIGICQNCYGRFAYWIKLGKTTWRKLANAGVCKVKTNALTLAMAHKKRGK